MTGNSMYPIYLLRKYSLHALLPLESNFKSCNKLNLELGHIIGEKEKIPKEVQVSKILKLQSRIG